MDWTLRSSSLISQIQSIQSASLTQWGWAPRDWLALTDFSAPFLFEQGLQHEGLDFTIVLACAPASAASVRLVTDPPTLCRVGSWTCASGQLVGLYLGGFSDNNFWIYGGQFVIFRGLADSPANCRVGSCFSLTGQLVIRLGLHHFSFTDWRDFTYKLANFAHWWIFNFAGTLTVWRSSCLVRHCSPPLCRVGSWVHFTGLEVELWSQTSGIAVLGKTFLTCPTGLWGLAPLCWLAWICLTFSLILWGFNTDTRQFRGLGTLADCPTGFSETIQVRRGWAPLFWLARVIRHWLYQQELSDLCRIGSCHPLTGLLNIPASVQTLKQRFWRLGISRLWSLRRGWAPLHWLVQRFIAILVKLCFTLAPLGIWFPISATIQFSTVWRIFNILFFWLGLVIVVERLLLLAKVALEWFSSTFALFQRRENSIIPLNRWDCFLEPSLRPSWSVTDCKPGPKSRRCAARVLPWRFLLALLGIYFLFIMQHNRGEGCDLAMKVTEVHTWSSPQLMSGTKPHGMRPPACERTLARPETAFQHMNKVTKRSLLRAYRRAQQQGMAWYRGQHYSASDFERMGCHSRPPDTPRMTPSQRTDLHQCNLHHATKRRLKLWQWNCSGLSIPKFDEVKAWLVLHQIDVAVLVETRWTYDATWTDSDWNMVHSGEGSHRGKGIVILISKRLCHSSQLQWQIHDSGRLVHLRVNLNPRSLDVLACYQHTYHPTQACRIARDRWWNMLEQVLGQLPSRNCLALMGDFNCSLGSSPRTVGTSTFGWLGGQCSGTAHPGQTRFLQLLRHYALVALNTWSARLGPTYVHGTAASRLDYICVRQPYADGLARQVRYLWDSPFLTQTDYGHVPMICTIAKHWIPVFAHHRIHAVSMQQRRTSRQAYMAQTPDWLNYAQCSQAELQEIFEQCTAPTDQFMEAFHNKMLETFCAHFPAGRTSSVPPAWRLTLPTLQNKWVHRKGMQRPGRGTVRNVFTAWFHVTRFMILKRLHRKQAFLIRAQRFREVVDSAVAAASQHNTHKLFQIINSFAPKQVRKQIQLRTCEGRMASPIESAALLNKFVADTWAGPQSLQLHFNEAPGVPFTVQQLEKALAAIPSCKAVAKPFAPGVVWRQHAPILAPVLHAKLQLWWSTNPPQIPCSWRHGWLFMIPKASKPPDIPQNLRPLALQEPVGKAVLGLIIHLAMIEAADHMVIFPIWAYMRHRSTLDAIRRVSFHCAEIRALLQHQRSTPHTRADHLPRFTLFGGLQICLDLRCAFDCVDRSRLFSRLSQLDISQSLIQLLTTWHEHSVYYVQHAYTDCSIPVGRGVRQGCKAAPGLWNCFVVLMLHDLLQHVPLQWVQQHITIYADDIHVSSKFVSLAEFQYCRKVVGILFSILESLQMHINSDKSVVILELRGSRSHALKQQIIRRDRDGEKLVFYKLDNNMVSIPIHKTAKYLGVVISYGNFEDLSLKHRLALMQTGFRRMQKWLLGKHSLSVNQRYQLWHTCIYPILSYGICATGLTAAGIKLATTQMTIMLRKLMHDHSYLTRRTNHHVFALHKLSTPAQLLHGTAAGLWRTLYDRGAALTEHDLARQIDWTHLPPLVNLLERLQATETLEQTWPSLGEACYNVPFFQCSQCDFCTDTASHFRRHCTQAHGHTMYRTRHVNISDYTTGGLPTCRFCQQSFTTWRMFTAHVQRGCQELLPGPTQCTEPLGRVSASLGSLEIMQPNLADAAARGLRLITADELHHLRQQAFGDRLLHIVQERLWERVPLDPEICQYLSSHCVICAHRFTRCQELHQHFRLQHAELWEYAPQKSIQLTNLFSAESPCACCGALFKTHSCPTWSQIAVLLVNGAGRDEQVQDPEVRQRCEICLECFLTTADSVRHLQDKHGLQGLSYNESRDSIDGTSACAHCGQLFQTMGGLRSHVVQGRCMFYNPQASAETREVDDSSKQACLDGKFLQVLQDPMLRMRLTVACLACGKGCKRAADLALHLQTAHSRLWRRSQRLTLIMVETFYKYRCFCNLSSGAHRTQHVCLPFRQLAMAFHRMNTEPFAPTVLTDQLLKDILADTLPRAAKHRLERALVHRAFSDTWQDSEILKLLREHCILCGAQPATSDLALHLREEHQCNHEMFLFYMEQLLPIALEPNLDHYQCRMCELVFNLPASLRPDESLSARAQLALSHLRGACPVLIQLAQLFGALLNGGHLRNGTVRHSGLCPDEGGFWSAGSTLSRSISQADGKSQAAQGQTTRRPKRQRRGDGQATSGFRDPEAPCDGGHPPGATRSGVAGSSKNGSIHSFFESRRSRGSSSHDAGDGQVETADGECIHISADATAPTPGPDNAECHENQSRPNCQSSGDRSTVPDFTGQGADLGGQELPFSSLGPGDQNLGAGQEAANQCHQNGAELGGIDRAVDSQGSGYPIPCTESSGCPDRQDSALAPSDSLAARSGLRSPSLSDIQCHLDGGGSNDEAAQLGAIPSGLHSPGHGGPDHFQGTGQGQGEEQATQEVRREVRVLSQVMIETLTQIACRLRLHNDRNWCYGNASMHSLIWCLLCLQFPMTDLWGPHFGELILFMRQHANKPAQLCDVEWFQDIVRGWGASQDQKDSAEFVQRALSWLRAAAFDLRWERRIETADRIHVHDSSSHYTPITLTIPEQMHATGHCTLSDLVTAWAQEHSMRAALLDASSCLCIHIDRFFRTEQGEVQKSLCRIDIDMEVTLPVFRDHALCCANAGYIPVAGVAHFGSDMAGHCKALLKMQPTVTASGQPATWLVTEDGQCPVPIWQYPQWFASNLVVIWMLRTDCLRLPAFPSFDATHDVAPVATLTTEPPASELLQLLRSQKGAFSQESTGL